MFDTDTMMHLLLNSMELCELYNILNTEEKIEFIRYIKMEYEAIDDEFSSCIEKIFIYLEKSKDGSELERNLELLIHHDVYPIENINIVITSMIEYLKDTINYIEQY